MDQELYTRAQQASGQSAGDQRVAGRRHSHHRKYDII